MPIDISEFAEPKFTRMRTRYPLSEDKKDRFLPYTDMIRNYRGDAGFKQGGYNPNHNSSSVEKINLTSEEFTLKPY